MNVSWDLTIDSVLLLICLNSAFKLSSVIVKSFTRSSWLLTFWLFSWTTLTNSNCAFDCLLTVVAISFKSCVCVSNDFCCSLFDSIISYPNCESIFKNSWFSVVICKKSFQFYLLFY